MATFFGEVLSVYSRAVEEDEEDIDENEEDEHIFKEMEEKREVRLLWNPEVADSLSSGHQLQCSDLLLAVGHNATRFLSVYFLSSSNWETVGHVSSWNEKRPGSEGSTCPLYRHKDNGSVLICQVNSYLAEDQLFQWTQKVFDCFQSTQLHVTVLSDCAVAEYRTADSCSGAVPFLRSLHTSAFTHQPICQPLDLPNLITGLPAAVLNHCQVHHISAVVYQCYSDVLTPDSVTMDTYRPTVTNLGKSLKVSLQSDKHINIGHCKVLFPNYHSIPSKIKFS